MAMRSPSSSVSWGLAPCSGAAMPTRNSLMPSSELLRFLLVGGCVFALDTGTFLLLYWLGVPSIPANAAGMLAGFLLGLVGHHYLTFRRAGSPGLGTALRYGGSFAFNLVLGTVVLELLLSIGQSALVAKLAATRSEEHTSELQSRENLVCRLLL